MKTRSGKNVSQPPPPVRRHRPTKNVAKLLPSPKPMTTTEQTSSPSPSDAPVTNSPGDHCMKVSALPSPHPTESEAPISSSFSDSAETWRAEHILPCDTVNHPDFQNFHQVFSCGSDDLTTPLAISINPDSLQPSDSQAYDYSSASKSDRRMYKDFKWDVPMENASIIVEEDQKVLKVLSSVGATLPNEIVPDGSPSILLCPTRFSIPDQATFETYQKKLMIHCIERFDLPAKYLIRNHDLIKNIVSGLMIMKEPPFSDTVENFNYWVERTSRQMAIPLSRITVKGTEFIIKNAAAFLLELVSPTIEVMLLCYTGWESSLYQPTLSSDGGRLLNILLTLCPVRLAFMQWFSRHLRKSRHHKCPTYANRILKELADRLAYSAQYFTNVQYVAMGEGYVCRHRFWKDVERKGLMMFGKEEFGIMVAKCRNVVYDLFVRQVGLVQNGVIG